MQTNAIQLWGNRAVTFVLAAVAAVSGTFWALKSRDVNSVSTVAPAAVGGFASLDPQAVARALGAGKVAVAGAADGGAQVSGASAYVLLGVLAGGPNGGAALIAVDGKAGKPYRVGTPVGANLVLQSVEGRSAVLAASAGGVAQLRLEMPPLSK